MAHKPPTSREEYESMYHENYRVSGHGLEVVTHLPCPFCCAPDMMHLSLLDIGETLPGRHACAECGRVLFVEVTFHQELLSKQIRMFQVSGPDADPWVSPLIPRLE